MGDCKSNMKPTKTKKPETKTEEKLFGVFPRKKTKVEDVPKTFADMLIEADSCLQMLLIKKEADLNTEKGKETENTKKLAFLKTMDFHLASIVDLASEYSEL